MGNAVNSSVNIVSDPRAIMLAQSYEVTIGWSASGGGYKPTYEDKKLDDEAYAAYEQKDYGRAVELYKSLALRTEQPVCYYNWGNALLNLVRGDVQEHEQVRMLLESESLFLKALARDPANKKIYNDLGTVYLLLAILKQGAIYQVKARVQFMKALELDPNYSKALYNLSLLDFMEKKSELMSVHMGKAIDNGLDRVSRARGLYFSGVRNFDDGNYPAAIDDFSAAIADGLPNDFRKLQYYLRECYLRMQAQQKKAQEEYKTEIEQEEKGTLAASRTGAEVVVDEKASNGVKQDSAGRPLTATDYFIQGQGYYKQGKYAKALVSFKKAVQAGMSIDDPELRIELYATHYHLGEEAFRKGDYANAVKHLERSQSYGLRVIRATRSYMLGFSYAELGDHAQAVKYLTKAIELGAASEVVYVQRAWSYCRLDMPAKAIADLEKCKVRDKFWDYYYAEASVSMGDQAAAERHYSDAIAKDPLFVSALYGRGTLYVQQRRYEEAAADFDVLVKIDPNDKLARYFLKVNKDSAAAGKMTILQKFKKFIFR